MTNVSWMYGEPLEVGRLLTQVAVVYGLEKAFVAVGAELSYSVRPGLGRCLPVGLNSFFVVAGLARCLSWAILYGGSGMAAQARCRTCNPV